MNPLLCDTACAEAIFEKAMAGDIPARRSVWSLARMRRVPLAVLMTVVCGGVPCMSALGQSVGGSGASIGSKPRELGAVRWLRDFDAALAESGKTGKPALVLFDEVPGCHTCVSYGETVLTHPLVVEAAEDLFVPVAVFNNVGGADKAVLESFGEPAWNNPVVRVVDSKRTDLAKRVDGDYAVRGIARAMLDSLKRSGRETPAYLTLLAEEAEGSARAERAVFSMHCFWEGEAKLGSVPGVLSTRTGFQGGREVVEVRYDPTLVSRSTLEQRASEMACRTEPGSGALQGSAKDDKYQLRHSVYASVPMTESQASRVNGAISAGEDPARYLSPRQAALSHAMARVEASKRPVFVGRDDLASAWREAEAAVRERNADTPSTSRE